MCKNSLALVVFHARYLFDVCTHSGTFGETGVNREGPSPPGPINSISWVGPGGDPIYNENRPFLILLECFQQLQ